MGMAAFFPDFRCFGVTGRADCFPDEWRILALAFHAVEVGEEQFLDFRIVLLEKILQNRIIVKITAEPGDPQVFRNFQLPPGLELSGIETSCHDSLTLGWNHRNLTEGSPDSHPLFQFIIVVASRNDQVEPFGTLKKLQLLLSSAEQQQFPGFLVGCSLPLFQQFLVHRKDRRRIVGILINQ